MEWLPAVPSRWGRLLAHTLAFCKAENWTQRLAFKLYPALTSAYYVTSSSGAPSPEVSQPSKTVPSAGGQVITVSGGLFICKP